MSKTFIPHGYKSLLSIKETEHAIVMIKDFFQLALSTELNLTRVTAPLFVECNTGLNDDLNGVERAVTFPVKDLNDSKMEIVHSLAKWKRVKIADMETGVVSSYKLAANVAITYKGEAGSLNSYQNADYLGRI